MIILPNRKGRTYQSGGQMFQRFDGSLSMYLPLAQAGPEGKHDLMVNGHYGANPLRSFNLRKTSDGSLETDDRYSIPTGNQDLGGYFSTAQSFCRANNASTRTFFDLCDLYQKGGTFMIGIVMTHNATATKDGVIFDTGAFNTSDPAILAAGGFALYITASNTVALVVRSPGSTQVGPVFNEAIPGGFSARKYFFVLDTSDDTFEGFVNTVSTGVVPVGANAGTYPLSAVGVSFFTQAADGLGSLDKNLDWNDNKAIINSLGFWRCDNCSIVNDTPGNQEAARMYQRMQRYPYHYYQYLRAAGYF